jgi:hypothetical protein
MSESRTQSIVFAVLGLGRGGKILYGTLFLVGVPAMLAYLIWLPRYRFSDQDEQLFRAARHGDRAAIEQALASGATIGAQAPIDGKTALFRAAVFGHADTVRLLLARGADPAARGQDNRTALDVVRDARAEEKDPAAGRALDAVADLLRSAEEKR